jgi:hypothetical protein
MGANYINKGKFAHVKLVEILRDPKKIHLVRRWELELDANGYAWKEGEPYFPTHPICGGNC